MLFKQFKHFIIIMPPSARTTVGFCCLGFCFCPPDVPLIAPCKRRSLRVLGSESCLDAHSTGSAVHSLWRALLLRVASQAFWGVSELLEECIVDSEISRRQLSRVFWRGTRCSRAGVCGGAGLFLRNTELYSSSVPLLSHVCLRGILWVRLVWSGQDLSDGSQAPTL